MVSPLVGLAEGANVRRRAPAAGSLDAEAAARRSRSAEGWNFRFSNAVQTDVRGLLLIPSSAAVVCAASLVVLIGLMAGCRGGGGDGTGAASHETDLTIVALNDRVGRAVFHLRCSPAGGDLPDSDKACAALGGRPELITDPKPFICPAGPWDVTVSGDLEGQAVRKRFWTCWTPQMETLGQLGLAGEGVLRAHLVPRREEAVLPGEEKVFPPGLLRATDLVSCDILGRHLEVAVPIEANGQPASEGWQGANGETVTLEVALEGDGSVRANCHRGA